MPVLEPRADVVIADAVRSPVGVRGGTVAGIRPAVLLAQTASGLLDRTLLEPGGVTKVLIAGGHRFEPIARETCALMGLAVRRPSAAGSGAKASVLHAAARAVGRRDVVLVLATSGAEARRTPSLRRVIEAERVAARWSLTRRELDDYAEGSRRRAREVSAMGEFGSEIVPAVRWSHDACTVVKHDETVAAAPDGRIGAPLLDDPDVVRRHPQLGWHHHSGNVSQAALGAAATILVGHDRALELGLRPRARILALTEGSATPELATVGTSRAAFAHAGVSLEDVDHYEVSESFAALPLAWAQEMGADVHRFNPRGGSIGLGSLGPADDLRSLATSLAALHATGGRLGILTSEGGNGAGEAMLLEYLQRPCCSRAVLGGHYCRDAAHLAEERVHGAR